ncbi:MAG: DUF1127 domain-containing protein [Pseudomonadota bacterium]
MAYVTYGNSAATSTSLRDRLVARIDAARVAWGQWRTYRTTLAELSRLSDRDLADLGLFRGNLREVAIKAAYGA